MSEDQILELVNQSLKTPKGKSLLGGDLDLAGISSRIEELQTKYSINLDNLKNVNIDDVNFSIGSNLTREERRKKRQGKQQTALERLQERLTEQNLDPKLASQKIIAEIQLLKNKLKSQIPRFEEFTISGRIFDQNTGNVLQGVRIQPGISPQQFGAKIEQPKLNGNEEAQQLISNKFDLPDPNDLIYTPIPGLIKNGPVITDSQGNFSIKMKIPVIPATQKVPLNIALLYTKGGFLPNSSPISF
mgnify:FL=1